MMLQAAQAAEAEKEAAIAAARMSAHGGGAAMQMYEFQGNTLVASTHKFARVRNACLFLQSCSDSTASKQPQHVWWQLQQCALQCPAHCVLAASVPLYMSCSIAVLLSPCTSNQAYANKGQRSSSLLSVHCSVVHVMHSASHGALSVIHCLTALRCSLLSATRWRVSAPRC
jgi:hypothetical protein